MKKLFIATLLAIMSLSVWGQSKLSPYTRHYVERIQKEKLAESRKQGNALLQKKINTRGQLVIPAFIYLNGPGPGSRSRGSEICRDGNPRYP